ncbi:MAG: hypothetical protein WC511_02160 [Candidatus Pacearchaeota archaeon]
MDSKPVTKIITNKQISPISRSEPSNKKSTGGPMKVVNMPLSTKVSFPKMAAKEKEPGDLRETDEAEELGDLDMDEEFMEDLPKNPVVQSPPAPPKTPVVEVKPVSKEVFTKTSTSPSQNIVVKPPVRKMVEVVSEVDNSLEELEYLGSTKMSAPKTPPAGETPKTQEPPKVVIPERKEILEEKPTLLHSDDKELTEGERILKVKNQNHDYWGFFGSFANDNAIRELLKDPMVSLKSTFCYFTPQEFDRVFTNTFKALCVNYHTAKNGSDELYFVVSSLFYNYFEGTTPNNSPICIPLVVGHFVSPREFYVKEMYHVPLSILLNK